MLETVTFKNTAFTVLVHATRGIVAINPGICCTQVLHTVEGHVNSFLVAHKAVKRFVSRIGANLCLIENGMELADVQGSAYLIPDLNLELSRVKPDKIPGTAASSTYVVMVRTRAGYIARREGDGMTGPRIRVQKTSNDNYWPANSHYVHSNENNTWETINSGHLSASGSHVKRSALLIARGLDILLSMNEMKIK